MRKEFVLLAILALAVLLIGCASRDYDTAGAASYSGQGGQAPVVGGGCGVTEQKDYADTPAVSSQEGF